MEVPGVCVGWGGGCADGDDDPMPSGPGSPVGGGGVAFVDGCADPESGDFGGEPGGVDGAGCHAFGGELDLPVCGVVDVPEPDHGLADALDDAGEGGVVGGGPRGAGEGVVDGGEVVACVVDVADGLFDRVVLRVTDGAPLVVAVGSGRHRLRVRHVCS